MEDRLITLAIHTYDHAHALKSLLESEGVEATLQNVNLAHPVVSAGMRVRIHESDLPLALRIIENPDLFGSISTDTPEQLQHILVPVDFSDYSCRACDLAFNLAYLHKSQIVLLHSFIGTYVAPNLQLTDSISYDITDAQENEIIEREAKTMMERFADSLRKKMKSGELPPVKFSTEVTEGIAEEEIVNYAKEHNPSLIVMGTRGAGKKERELVGSVTAEVLDTCRFPVFTVPESCPFVEPSKISQVVFFCNLDQEDMLGVDALHRFLPESPLQVTLANIPSRKQPSNVKESIDALLQFCREHYPRYTFNSVTLAPESLVEDYHKLETTEHIDLICVPNKKKNIFARFFNPGIAHKLLFHADIPMMVIPV